jgi:hypothetical protein
MMSDNLDEDENNIMTCCASCGIAEVDDIKLKKCAACVSFDIAALNVRGIISRNTNDGARKERLNCVTKFYSNNQKTPISVTARFVFCRYRLI